MKTNQHLMGALLGSMLVLLSAQNTYSQGFYVNAGGGYNFSANSITYVNLCPGFDGIAPSYDESNITPFSFLGANQAYTSTSGNQGSNYSNTYQSLNKGFGGGVNFCISAGYSFNKYISAELGVSYQSGTTLQSTYTDQETTNLNPNQTEITSETITSKLTSSPTYGLLPAVKFSIPVSKFTPYLKAGLIVELGEKATVSNTYFEVQTEIYNGIQTSGTPENDNVALTASGGLSLGYTGSVGVDYKISDLISVYGEFNIINDSWSPTKGDITTLTVSGANPPYVLSANQFTYSDNITTGGPATNSNPGNNVIEVNSQYPKQTFSFNSYGFAIGVKFFIPSSKSATPTSPVSPPKAN